MSHSDSHSGSFYDRTQHQDEHQLSLTFPASASGQANPHAPPMRSSERATGHSSHAMTDGSQFAPSARQPTAPGLPMAQYSNHTAPVNPQHPNNPATMHPTTAFTLDPHPPDPLPFPYAFSAFPAPPSRSTTYTSSLAGATDFITPMPQLRAPLSSGGGVIRRAMSSVAQQSYQDLRPTRYHRRASSERFPDSHGRSGGLSFSQDEPSGLPQVCRPSGSSNSKLIRKSQDVQDLGTNRGSHVPIDASIFLPPASLQLPGNFVPELPPLVAVSPQSKCSLRC